MLRFVGRIGCRVVFISGLSETEPVGARQKSGRDRLTNRADRQQQDHNPDRNEDIVEAVDQLEILFRLAGKGANAAHMIAKIGRGCSAERSGGDGGIDIVFGIHERAVPNPLRGVGVIHVYYYVNTP